MKKTSLVRLVAFIIAVVFVIGSFISDQRNPPEIATVTNLKVGYYSSEEGWVISAPIPISEREIRVCGLMQKSKQDTLLFTITNPDDINDFIRLDKSYFEIQPGDFCIRLYTLGVISPGKHTLWVLDARRTAGKLDFEYQESE